MEKGDTHRSDGLWIAQQNPQLENSEGSNPGSGKKPDPFHTECSTQAETSSS